MNALSIATGPTTMSSLVIAETITLDQLWELSCIVVAAGTEIFSLHRQYRDGDVSPEFAAAKVNDLIAKINAAAK